MSSWTEPIGDNPLSLWLQRQRLEVEQAKILERIAREVGGNVAEERAKHRLPGDPSALRGLPAVCVRGGFGGAIRGTLPHVDGVRRTGAHYSTSLSSKAQPGGRPRPSTTVRRC